MLIFQTLQYINCKTVIILFYLLIIQLEYLLFNCYHIILLTYYST